MILIQAHNKLLNNIILIAKLIDTFKDEVLKMQPQSAPAISYHIRKTIESKNNKLEKLVQQQIIMLENFAKNREVVSLESYRN